MSVVQKKILLCATVDYHFKAFHLPTMKRFKELGWDVHIAASGSMDLPYVDQKFNIPIQRSPFKLSNIQAYKQLKDIVSKNQYDFIHCHTPLGGVISRLAARTARKTGTKVIYTAHGFHFCKGAPLINWVMYYPIEKTLSKYTDCLITINKEDYTIAKTRNFRAGEIKHVHGVGVDTYEFKPIIDHQKETVRKKYGYQPNDFLLFYAAEFNKNKNQQQLIKAIASIKEKAPTVRLLLAGEGSILEDCRSLADSLHVQNQVEFLGFRKDISQILTMCDLAVASSYREGLPVNIMEAMACGLPVIATENRGHKELIKNNINGFLIPPNDHELFGEKILEILVSKKLRQTFGSNSISLVKKFSLEQVNEQLFDIYGEFMSETEGFEWAIQ